MFPYSITHDLWLASLTCSTTLPEVKGRKLVLEGMIQWSMKLVQLLIRVQILAKKKKSLDQHSYLVAVLKNVYLISSFIDSLLSKFFDMIIIRSVHFVIEKSRLVLFMTSCKLNFVGLYHHNNYPYDCKCIFFASLNHKRPKCFYFMCILD